MTYSRRHPRSAMLASAAPSLVKLLIKIHSNLIDYCDDHNSKHPTDLTLLIPEIEAALETALGEDSLTLSEYRKEQREILGIVLRSNADPLK